MWLGLSMIGSSAKHSPNFNRIHQTFQPLSSSHHQWFFYRNMLGIQQLPPNTEPPMVTVVIPYIQNLSESIRWVLIPLRIQTCFRPYQTQSQVFMHLTNRKAVVYWIPCLDRKMMYVGQTGRTLQIRMKKHMWAFTNSDAIASALAEHTMDNSHRIA